MNTQQNKIIWSSGNIMCSSVPGSGKTKTLVERLAYLIKTKNIDQERILVLTFTNDAVTEILERSLFLNYKQNIFIKTIDSFFVYCLREYYKDIKITDKETTQSITVDQISDLLYETCQDEEFCLNIKSKFDYIMIDEFQDTSVMQWNCIKKLFNNHKNFMVIGDPNQSIYGWRGSAPNIFSEFGKLYNAKRINLFINYRSSEKIIDLAKRILALNIEHPKLVCYKNMKTSISINYDEIKIAQFLKDKITYLNTIKKIPLERMCILTRYNEKKGECDIYNPWYIKYLLKIEGISFLEENMNLRKIEYEILQHVKNSIKKFDKVEYKYIEENHVISLSAHAKNILRNINKDNYKIFEKILLEEFKKCNRININTIHGSKGQEYDVIFMLHPTMIPRLQSILFYPCTKNKRDEEEVRLTYVGITRARQHLHIITNRDKMRNAFSKTYELLLSYLS